MLTQAVGPFLHGSGLGQDLDAVVYLVVVDVPWRFRGVRGHHAGDLAQDAKHEVDLDDRHPEAPTEFTFEHANTGLPRRVLVQHHDQSIPQNLSVHADQIVQSPQVAPVADERQHLDLQDRQEVSLSRLHLVEKIPHELEDATRMEHRSRSADLAFFVGAYTRPDQQDADQLWDEAQAASLFAAVVGKEDSELPHERRSV